METIVDKKTCTGCTSCMNICPKGAINFKQDIDGFKYPIINKSKCINCGLCKRTCPVLNTKKNNSINECYVAYNKDMKERLNASSGSIFSLIANLILDNNGIVIGAAFNDKNHLKHIAIEKKEDLDLIKKSKYLQSDLGDIFKYVKEQLANRKVLFVGTPCQVAGLKSFIKSDYDNLICIDLFCHGVPSPALFKKYINELENKNKDVVVGYDFRDNSTGWDNYSNTVYFKKMKMTELRSNNKYMKLFLSDVALRESCYNCNFKLGNKYSDITLGDFWGVKKHYPEMYNKEGVSAVIINTEKGIKIFKLIEDSITYKKCNIDEIVIGNSSLIRSVKRRNDRVDFFVDLEKKNINELVRKYVPKTSFKKKVKNILKKVLIKN